MSNDIGKIIHSQRTALGLTLEEVGNAVGVGKSTVKKWEDGFISNMKRDKIALLAEVLQISPVTFITGVLTKDITEPQIANIIPLPLTKNIPLLGDIACGEPILAEENISDYIKADISVHADFALRCKGDSMINARIFDGDIVYIRQQSDVDDGEIAAVLIGDEATLKKVYKTENKLVLRPCNPMYDDLVYSNDALDSVRILGKAIMFTSLIRHGK
ncbi:MAG: helix-turn-helix domain-containing protein [Clostridia bacterium]|nr:helix-turn-helix domain-containing protein [Clostridia bacterium]